MRHPIDNKLKNWRHGVQIFFKGFCMGMADIVPGISGGTIALILGVYEDLIEAIKSFNINCLKAVLRGHWREALALVPWRFIGALLMGIGSAILLFSKLIHWLMQQHPVMLNAFFFGLICATVPLIAKMIRQWTLGKLIGTVCGAWGTMILVRMIPVVTPDTAIFLFGAGAIAICAMILPGISGAFILVVLGKYEVVLQAISEGRLDLLCFFCVGIIVGICSFARVLSWLFKQYHDGTMAVLLGVVAGSLIKIWPWKHTTDFLTTSHGKLIPIKQINYWPSWETGGVMEAVMLMGLGVVLAIFLNKSNKPLVIYEI